MLGDMPGGGFKFCFEEDTKKFLGQSISFNTEISGQPRHAGSLIIINHAKFHSLRV